MKAVRMECYIFGAGKNGRELLEFLNRKRTIEVKAFIDNDSDKQKKRIDGKECISVDEAIGRGAQNEIVLISPADGSEIEQMLLEKKFRNIFYAGGWKYFMPVVLEESDYNRACPFNQRGGLIPRSLLRNKLFQNVDEVIY